MPAVSVIMPAYNVAPYLAEAIDSVLAQTFHDFELIIVDDGSPDQTLELANRYAERHPGRIIVASKPNGGLAAARNTALKHASGDIIALLDSDDVWDPEFLEEQIAILLAHSDVSIVTGNARYRGGPLDGQPARPFPDSRPSLTLTTILEDETAVFVMSVFRRTVIDTVGGFDEALRTNEDYDVWIRAAMAGFRFMRNPRPLGEQRRRADSLSASDVRMIRGILRVYEKARAQCDVASPARSIIDRQIDRFEAEALAAEARQALEARNYRQAAAHLAALRARRGGMPLACAAALVRFLPATAARAYRLRGRVRAYLASRGSLEWIGRKQGATP